jgi:hypothetical protein
MPKVGLLGGYNALRAYGDPLANKKNWVVSGLNQASMIVAPNGNIYTMGWISNCALIFCFNPQGYLIWQRLTNGYFGNTLASMAVDSASNLYISGYDTVPNSFLFKIDSTGNLSWVREISGNVCYALTVDSSDNIYVAAQIYSGTYPPAFYSFNSSGTLNYQTIIIGISSRTLTYCNGYLYSIEGVNLTKLTLSGTVVWNYVLSGFPGGVYFGISECYANPYTGSIWATGNTIISSTNRLIVMEITETGGVPSIAFQIISDQNNGSPVIANSYSGITMAFDSSASYIASNATILKYDNSNNLVWQRYIGGEAGWNSSLATQGNNFIFNGYGGTDFLGSLPKDGSKIGSYAGGAATFNYSATSYTFSPLSMTLSAGATVYYNTNYSTISNITTTLSTTTNPYYRIAI